MVRNIRLIIEYDGTNFNGWQRQDLKTKQDSAGYTPHNNTHIRRKIKTIQGEVEKACKRLFGKVVKVIGASRTDSGVHAEGQVANFKVESELSVERIKRGLNSYLPREIVILSADDVPLDFHSRYDAKKKLYRYRIINRDCRSPLLQRYAVQVPYRLDIKALRKAARYFLGKKDFKAFQTKDKKEKNSIRTVSRLDIFSKKGLIEIYIEADGFLYNMVRNIVGTLIDVARGRLKPEDVKEILSKKKRYLTGYTAPAKGLCLVKVCY